MQLKKILSHLKSKGVVLELIGDDSVEITQVSGLDIAKPGEISFLTDKKYLTHLNTTQAEAVILQKNLAGDFPCSQILVDNPYYIYALVAQFLNPMLLSVKGIHKSAQVDASASVDDSVTIQENAVVQSNVKIGHNTVISAGAVLESGVVIGTSCRIGSNVTICHDCVVGDNVFIEAGTVIGGDGFGWANNQGQWVKIPQVGRVLIGNNVSIGNNATIDRGAIQDTVIEDNCIIDNLVHIAHNVEIGSGSAIAGQTGFAGSTTLGKNCTVAGQVGFSGHIEITDNVHFLAKSGVTHNINESGAYAGFPAVKASDWQKNSVRIRQLDKLAKQVKALQKQVDLLTE
ncbi:MAG TPA: UDP-3-O-(3-hydroxymyristoyl)glucosamine N-acyltransferase [Thiomicrospira sp.]|nr:UDP-3-O-(3-hydroxymyristoyl)glucosamine N-acyltransferase [Thiomicrospira sp.]